MSIFSGATNNSFTGSTFIVQSNDTTPFERLKNAASPSAFHSFVGSPQPGKCYPNTRITLLEGLWDWNMGLTLPDIVFEAGLCRDHNVDKEDQLRNLPIVWLTGGAGAGKSAVAQTFAEWCEDLGNIVASFFFFSTDPTRNHSNCLVATLAYQIAQADSHARAHIKAVIHNDPHIFNKDLKRQITSLIVNPCQIHLYQ